MDNKVPDFSKAVRKIIKNRPIYAAVEAKNFFQECFRKQGWTDGSFSKWEAKIPNPLSGKDILVGADNSMNLMGSIRILEQNQQVVRVGSQLIYAGVHNDGAEITVTKKMKAYFWWKYYRFSNAAGLTKRRTSANDKAEFCKRMALMKEGHRIKIPKRQFIGESKTLIENFEKWYARQIGKSMGQVDSRIISASGNNGASIDIK